ncbi:23S rRNA (adenine(2503)-C(2))-methyltransferase RlmN, partial [Enterococcus faecalis]
VTCEYIMMSQVNERAEQAQQLADLLRNKIILSYVYLIPYNPVSEHDHYSRTSKEAVLKFYDLHKKNGINCDIRKEHGTEID